MRRHLHESYARPEPEGIDWSKDESWNDPKIFLSAKDVRAMELLENIPEIYQTSMQRSGMTRPQRQLAWLQRRKGPILISLYQGCGSCESNEEDLRWCTECIRAAEWLLYGGENEEEVGEESSTAIEGVVESTEVIALDR